MPVPRGHQSLQLQSRRSTGSTKWEVCCDGQTQGATKSWTEAYVQLQSRGASGRLALLSQGTREQGLRHTRLHMFLGPAP